MGRAVNHWHYSDGDMAQTAAAVTHGVGQAQAYENGNKRTAYWTTHFFLNRNGLGHLMPDDDVELARHIEGYGKGTHSLEDTASLFRKRMEGWKASATKVAMPIIKPKYNIIEQHRDDYLDRPHNHFYDEAYRERTKGFTSEDWRRQREKEREWDYAIRHALGTGKVTPEQAVERGFEPTGWEGDSDWGSPKWGKWQPLPEKVYHVTTNLPGVLRSGGLYSPSELDLDGKGRGLGGGTQDTISLTDSREEAENIKRAILEGADVASGRLPIERMVEMAEKGEGANEPWLRKMFGTHDWSTGNPEALDDLLHGRQGFYNHLLPEDHPLRALTGGSWAKPLPQHVWEQHGYYPRPGAYALGQPGNPVYTGNNVYRNLSPEEKAHAAFDWWRNPWAPNRGWSGGPSDPMFTGVDPHWFANLDPSHVGTLELQPVPGAHGYPMSSLGEWRIPTGAAVRITGHDGKAHDPDDPERYGMTRTGDGPYGFTNSHTADVILALDNNYYDGLNEKSREMVEQGAMPKQLEDWLLTAFISKHNAEQMSHAQDWNEIPEDERPNDPDWQRGYDKHGEKWVDMVGPAPERKDAMPNLVDPELVNWQEVWQHIKDELDENVAWNQREQEKAENAQQQGWDFPTGGGDENANHMHDAIHKMYGARPGASLTDPGHPANTLVHIPFEHFPEYHREWPESFVTLDARRELHKRNNEIYQRPYLEGLRDKYKARGVELPEDRLEEMAYNLMRHDGINAWDQPYDMDDPIIRHIIESDPGAAKIMQDGYNERLTEFANENVAKIQRGNAHPWVQDQFRQALAQQGHSPERIQQIMAPKYRLDPQTKRYEPINPVPQAPPAPKPEDPLLDKPGELTLPPEWTASQRRANSMDPIGPVTVWGQHVGTPENIEAIRRDGFNLDLHKRGTWGRGVYVHVNGASGTSTPGGGGGAKVNAQFTLQRPLHTALNYRSQIDYDHPGQQEFDRITKGVYDAAEQSRLLQEAGYDGVVVHKESMGELKPHVAVAFDPAAVQLDAAYFPTGYRLGNILDPVRPNLDPAVFDHAGDPEPHLKPALREWIVDTVHNILEEGGYEGPERWLTLFLTGSLTTYQYSDSSDCDVSLFVNHHVFPEWSRAEMIALMVDKLDGVSLPGTPHPMQVFVVASGIEPADLYRKGLRSGYDLDADKWFLPPEKDRAHDVASEDPEGYVNGLMAADKMDRLLRYEPDKAITYYEQLHRKRKADQADGKGDYAQSNLIYKMLDNRGLFDQLRALGVNIA